MCRGASSVAPRSSDLSAFFDDHDPERAARKSKCVGGSGENQLVACGVKIQSFSKISNLLHTHTPHALTLLVCHSPISSLPTMLSFNGGFLPAGTFDSVADDAIWGSAAPAESASLSSAPESETANDVVNKSCAFKDVDVDIGTDTSCAFKDVDVDIGSDTSCAFEDVDIGIGADTSCAFEDVDVDIGIDTVRAFKDVDIDIGTADDDGFPDVSVDAAVPTEASIVAASPKEQIQPSTLESEPSSHTHQQLFLLGSTFSSNKMATEYVAVNLAHILDLNPKASTKLAKKLKRDHGANEISLGIMTVDKCKDVEAKLQSRDIDCRSVPATNVTAAVTSKPTKPPKPPKPPTKKVKKSFMSMKSKPKLAMDEASAALPSVANSIPPLPPGSCVETQSRTSQKPTPRINNLTKAIGGKLSSAASQRKPNFVSASRKRSGSNASSITFGDVIKARTKAEDVADAKKNAPKFKKSRKAPSSSSSPPPPAKVANRRSEEASSTHKSLVFSSGVYEGEKRDGKPHGKGTFTMPGQFSYTGEWTKGNPSGTGFFKLANGEIREGSWDGTNFIEHRRISPKPSQPKAISIPEKIEEDVPITEGDAEKPVESHKDSNSIGQFDIVLENSSSTTTSPLPSLSESGRELQMSSPRPLDMLKKESYLSGISEFPPECFPYLAKLKTIVKSNTSKEGSLRTENERIMATVTYNDIGGKYDGEWKGSISDGLPNGMGLFNWDDGA